MNRTEIYKVLQVMTTVKPAFIIMVGPAGSGKSSVTQYLAHCMPIKVMNTDAKVEAKGKAMGLEYHQAFGQVPYGGIWQDMVRQVWMALNYGQTVLIDQTNMTRESRAKKLELCKTKHWRICIDMITHAETCSVPELAERTKLRYEQGGRFVPEKVIQAMMDKYEEPVIAEGFDLIFHITDQ